jgi:hypothetical protein
MIKMKVHETKNKDLKPHETIMYLTPKYYWNTQVLEGSLGPTESSSAQRIPRPNQHLR